MKQKAMLAIVTSLASIAIALIIQQQDVAAFNPDHNSFVGNTHGHTNCHVGGCDSLDGHVLNDKDSHSNDNFNSHRTDPGPKINEHDKPNNDK